MIARKWWLPATRHTEKTREISGPVHGRRIVLLEDEIHIVRAGVAYYLWGLDDHLKEDGIARSGVSGISTSFWMMYRYGSSPPK